MEESAKLCYNEFMTWDYTNQAYKKQSQKDEVWALEREINYGLEGKKLNKALLIKHFDELNIPKEKKDFLALLLWNKQF